MITNIYNIHFLTAVHIGNGKLSDAEITIGADTLFSALCHEALQISGTDGIGRLVKAARENKLRISDMLPFVGDTYFLPKPLLPLAVEHNGDSVQKKKFKKLKYVSADKLTCYLNGELDPDEEGDRFKSLGYFEMRTMSSSKDPDKILTGDMLPFQVGSFRFREGNGLYVIASFENEQICKEVESLLANLSFSGIGGKRSAGLGRFRVEKRVVSDAFKKLLACEDEGGKHQYMTLSTSMARPDELQPILKNANYLLIRRAGFVSSSEYSATMMRKKDFYAFSVGSCFEQKYEGDVFDVGDGGAHSVYRYGKPMFIEV